MNDPNTFKNFVKSNWIDKFGLKTFPIKRKNKRNKNNKKPKI